MFIRKNCFVYLFIFAGVASVSSCATILNGKTTRVHVYTNLPANISVSAVSSVGKITSCDFAVKRSKLPLMITARGDSISKTVAVKAGNSVAFWLNLNDFFPYGLAGFWLDWKNPKRYTYPGNIYLDLTNKDSSYERKIPIPEKYRKYTYVLSLTPLKISDVSNPAVVLTGEKKLTASLSGAAMFGYLLPGYKLYAGDIKPKTQGITAGLQLKWFLHRSAPQGLYTALGFDYLVNSYHASANFTHLLPDSALVTRVDSYPDTFSVHKQTYTVNVMIGYQRIYKRFSLDVYGGLGIRFKNVVHTGRKFPGDAWSSNLYESIINYAYTKNHEGKYSGLSVPLNIRIGWTF